MATSKKPGLNREQVAELYTDVRKAMAQVKNGSMPSKKAASKGSDAEAAKAIAMEIKRAMSKDTSSSSSSSSRSSARDSDQFDSQSSRYSDVMPPVASNRNGVMTVSAIVALGLLKIILGGIEATGLFEAKPAMASMISEQHQGTFGEGYSREEVRVLQSLDARRVELDQQSHKLETRAQELDVRDREFTIRSSQLKDLAEKLKLDRDKTEKKRDAQVEQLANVYSSMGPQEAAQLLEQLDVTIALPLIEHMPEKKIGQILALMGRERALMLTKMLSSH